MTNKETAKVLRSAASAIEHGRNTTFRKKLVAVAKDVNLWPGDGDSSAFARVATAAVREARPNKLADSLLEQDEALGPAFDAALDSVEQILQKFTQGTVWAGKYEPLQLAALFKQHIETHLCEELLAIAEYGDFYHWLEAGKPEPSFDHVNKGAHLDESPAEIIHKLANSAAEFPCEYCPHVYESIMELIRHVRDAHGPMSLKEAVDLCRSWQGRESL